MKIYKILHVISSLSRGGRERQLATIYKYSDKDQYQTRILIFNKTSNTYIEEYGIEKSDLFYLKTKNPISRLARIKRIVASFKPDIVYSWGGFESSFCLLAVPFTKSKLINGSIRHGIVRFNSKQISRLLGLHLSKFIVANSQAGLNANFIKNRGFVLYNGIDQKFIQFNSASDKTAKKKSMITNYQNEPVLISVANMVPYKDYFTILKALRNIKQQGFRFRYFIIGDGAMKNVLEHTIEEYDLGEEVFLKGRVSNVQDYLHLSDIFIHSSLGEGCSNAILEAMAAGLPVIATNTGGTSEIVNEKNGRLFEYKSVDQLTVALEELLTNDKLRSEKAKAAYQFINENFTIDKMISNYYQILSEVSQNKKTNASAIIKNR